MFPRWQYILAGIFLFCPAAYGQSYQHSNQSTVQRTIPTLTPEQFFARQRERLQRGRDNLHHQTSRSLQSPRTTLAGQQSSTPPQLTRQPQYYGQGTIQATYVVPNSWQQLPDPFRDYTPLNHSFADRLRERVAIKSASTPVSPAKSAIQLALQDQDPPKKDPPTKNDLPAKKPQQQDDPFAEPPVKKVPKPQDPFGEPPVKKQPEKKTNPLADPTTPNQQDQSVQEKTGQEDPAKPVDPPILPPADDAARPGDQQPQKPGEQDPSTKKPNPFVDPPRQQFVEPPPQTPVEPKPQRLPLEPPEQQPEIVRPDPDPQPPIRRDPRYPDPIIDDSHARPPVEPYRRRYVPDFFDQYSPAARMPDAASVLQSDCLNCGVCGDFGQYPGYEPAYYFSLFAGPSIPDDLSAIDSGGTQIDFELSTGYVAGFALGQRQGHNLRTELEFAFRSQSVSSFTLNSTQQFGLTGDLDSYSGMANLYWEFMGCPLEKWKPYVGAGIGFAIFDPSLRSLSPPTLSASFDDSSFAYQFMAGINHRLDAQTDLFVEYRYFGTSDVQIDSALAPFGITSNGSARFDVNSDNVFFGVRLKF